jgi:hypothetical protein
MVYCIKLSNKDLANLLHKDKHEANNPLQIKLILKFFYKLKISDEKATIILHEYNEIKNDKEVINHN